MLHPPDYIREYHEIGPCENIIDIESDETTPHGRLVNNILFAITDENIQFNYYCIVERAPEIFDNRDTVVYDGDLIEAIVLAEEHDVDILNISLGFDHAAQDDKESCSEYVQNCGLTDVARQAVLNGMVLVSAAGNSPQMKSVCCPGLQGEVISVGGVVPRCGRKDDLPPGACWIYQEEMDEPPEVICSDLGCGPGYMCSDNRENIWWENNVKRLKNKPDILAPVHFPIGDESGAIMASGTSLAVPLVSATVADIFQAFKGEDIPISPPDIRNAIRKTGRDMGLPREVLSGIDAFNELGEPYGMRFERNDGNLFDI